MNGLRLLDLASAKDRRVSIIGDVQLDIASSHTTHHDDDADDDDDDDDEW